MNRHNRRSSSPGDLAVDRLRAKGLRRTRVRRALLAILAERHGPFSTAELHEGVAQLDCDRVTVYRTMSALEEAGLVCRCEFGDGVTRYELASPESHHHHVICRRCRQVETIEACVAEHLEALARAKGYRNVTHTMELFGICSSCQRAAG